MVTKTINNKKMVLEQSMETRTRTIETTVMVPYTVPAKEIKTVQKPVVE